MGQVPPYQVSMAPLAGQAAWDQVVKWVGDLPAWAVEAITCQGVQEDPRAPLMVAVPSQIVAPQITVDLRLASIRLTSMGWALVGRVCQIHLLIVGLLGQVIFVDNRLVGRVLLGPHLYPPLDHPFHLEGPMVLHPE